MTTTDRYHFTEETDSTNRAVTRLGIESPVTLRAAFQTAGRGRYGRTWQAEKDAALLFSTMYEYPLPGGDYMERLTLLAPVTAMLIARSLEKQLSLPADALQFKWPNDLLHNGKKLGGILIETEVMQSVKLIIGAGINLKNVPAGDFERAPVALADISPRPLPDADLLCRLINEQLDSVMLHADIPEVLHRAAEVCSREEYRLYARGSQISFGGRMVTIRGLDEDSGALVVHTPDGIDEALRGGDEELEWP